MIPHDGLVMTSFKEFPPGTYEFRKAQALTQHLRNVADLVSVASHVAICSKAPERPWVGLQEWDTAGGLREGQWVSDLDILQLP